jgi:oxaloacetate decarboxylase beta subunit
MLRDILIFLEGSGFGQLSLGNLIMIGIGLLFIFLAIRKGFEPLLLVPIGFGILIGNIPYNSQQLSLSVYDGPVSESVIDYYSTQPLRLSVAPEEIPAWSRLAPVADKLHHHGGNLTIVPPSMIKDLVATGQVVMISREQTIVYDGKMPLSEPGVYTQSVGGRRILFLALNEANRYPVVIERSQQDPWNASVMWYIFRGIEWGIFPPLIFLGVGALTDFGPLLANPRLILLGAAAQFGIFGALLLAVVLGFDMKEAASIGIIGGADGPTAIFTCTKLAPHLLGAVALAAYSYMAMVPIIQPPIMRLLTTRKERLIRMEQPKNVSRTLKIVFPIAGFLLTAFIANGALPLLGMLFLGNLLRESMVTERLAKTAQTTLIDIVTILLGVAVGAKTQASNFLTTQTIYIFILGVAAFALATAGGVIFGKIMNWCSTKPINPLIGAAGVSAVPMAARVVQKVAHQEDPQNFLLMHAMGPNVAGVIGSAVAAGVLLSHLN